MGRQGLGEVVVEEGEEQELVVTVEEEELEDVMPAHVGGPQRPLSVESTWLFLPSRSDVP